jgi:hypothetical protein
VYQVEGERATWHLVQLTGRRGEAAGGEKRRRRKEKGDEEEEVGVIASTDSVTKWFWIFYICNICYRKGEDEPGCTHKGKVNAQIPRSVSTEFSTEKKCDLHS